MLILGRKKTRFQFKCSYKYENALTRFRKLSTHRELHSLRSGLSTHRTGLAPQCHRASPRVTQPLFDFLKLVVYNLVSSFTMKNVLRNFTCKQNITLLIKTIYQFDFKLFFYIT